MGTARGYDHSTWRGTSSGRMLVAALLATLLAVGAMVGVASPAGAVGAEQPGRVVSDDPVNWTPHALNGEVEAIAEVGDLVVAGGNFTSVRTASSTTAITRNYLFVFQRNSGAITSVAPSLNGEVMAIVPTGDGRTVWVGGGFNSVNGQTVRSLVKLDVTTGQRVTQFNAPAFNGRVDDLALRNGRLYVTGRFTTVGGQPQALLAVLDPTTGALVPSAKIDFSDPRSGGSLSIISSDVTPDGSRMVVIGNFTRIGGLPRYQIGVLDLTTSPISVADWSTGLYGDGCSKSFQTYMRDVSVAPDGQSFAVATTGAYNTTFLCDTIARWDLTATGSDLQPYWANYSGGDTFTQVAMTKDVTYAGGHFSYMNNPYAGDAIGAGAAPREALAALDNRSGATLSWDPTRQRGVGPAEFLVTDQGLWIGSDTDLVRGEYHGRLAYLPLAGGVALPQEFTGSLPGQVVSLGTTTGTGTDLDRTRSRTMAVGGPTSAAVTAAGTFDWRNLRGAFMVDGQLYTGWSDRTFRVQPYDGATFGPQTAVPLQLVADTSASLNRFATEDLSTITGMFYDRSTGRMYFTRSGSTRLSYRSFATESRVVGATRVDSAPSAGGVDWSTVRSMFLAEGYLFYGDTSGNLYRRAWDAAAGLPTGAATLVSGPGVDGQDWRARDAFVLAGSGVSTNQPPAASFTSSCAGATCNFDGSGSTDPDGTVASWSWDFGDGTTPGVGAQASHVYAASGTYTVTLTVTDDDGASTSSTGQVSVSVPNVAPTASFTASCTGLTCAVDGSASSDPDGTITAWAWSFGDGSTGSGPTASHTYGAAGTYTVTLTVTDDDGASRSATRSVSVVDPNTTPTVEFRAAAGVSVGSTAPSVTVPAAVQPGDVMVLLATVSSTSTPVTGPAGWTLLSSGSDATADAQTYAWSRTAAAGDAGRAVSISTPVVGVKTALQVVAYDGAGGVGAASYAFDTVSRAARTTPLVNVSTPGSRLVSYWADKSSATTGWTLPAAVTLRNQAVGSGSGRIVAAVGDSGPLGAGPAGGLTATADSANRRGVVWSIVLNPDTAAPNVPPTATFSTACGGLTCSFDGSASSDPDGTVTSRSWTFGDGATATGATASHTYAAPGTYTVSLTVADDDGATSTTSQQVTVAVVAKVATFRSANGVSVNSTAPAVTVPADVQPGDLLVLVATTNNTDTTLTGPAGWTAVRSGADPGGVQSALWTRTAVPGDAGSTVSVSTPLVGSKTALQVLAYRDAGGVSASAVAFETTQRADHTTPSVAVSTPGSALVSVWADKSSNTTTWTLPAGTAGRNQVVGTGSGRIVAAVGDNGSLATGSAGGLTAVASSAARRAAMWSIVVAPSA